MAKVWDSHAPVTVAAWAAVKHLVVLWALAVLAQIMPVAVAVVIGAVTDLGKQISQVMMALADTPVAVEVQVGLRTTSSLLDTPRVIAQETVNSPSPRHSVRRFLRRRADTLASDKQTPKVTSLLASR